MVGWRIASARDFLDGTIMTMPDARPFRYDVGTLIDFSQPGREVVETYFTRDLSVHTLSNLTLSTAAIDRYLGVSTKGPAVSRATLDVLLGGFVLERHQVAHLLSYERRVSVWTRFARTQPYDSGIIRTIAAFDLGTRFEAYRRTVRYRHLERDASAAQRIVALRLGRMRQSALDRDEQFDPAGKHAMVDWEFGNRWRTSPHDYQGSPSSEWLIGELGNDLAKWELFCTLGDGWTGNLADLVACVHELGR